MACSNCARLSARSKVSSRAWVRLRMVSLLAASAVNSASRSLQRLDFLIRVIHLGVPEGA